MEYGVRPETQGVSLALCCHQAVRHFCNLGMMIGCQTANSERKLNRIQGLACLWIKGAMRTIPTNVVEVFICFPLLDLVVQSEARSVAHRLRSKGCWSYLHPNRGHRSVLIRLQQSDPIFNMWVDVMRPVYNFEHQ